MEFLLLPLRPIYVCQTYREIPIGPSLRSMYLPTCSFVLHTDTKIARSTPCFNTCRLFSTISLDSLIRTLFQSKGRSLRLFLISKDVSRRRKKLKRCPPGHDARFDALFDLAAALYERFEKEHKINDLNEAIALGCAAVELRPVENDAYDRSKSLHCLALCLSIRHDEQGAVQDLEAAITLGRTALQLRPPKHPCHSESLYSLAYFLRKRFQRQAAMHDLDEAIELHHAALKLHPSGHPGRPLCLHELALCLSIRHSEQGAVHDLEEAITLGRAELELCPPGHTDRGASLYNLAWYLAKRFREYNEFPSLEEAIGLHHAALELRPPGHPDRSSSLQNLCHCLRDRYAKLEVVTDLEDVITLGHAALDLHPPGHPDRDASLNNLAGDLKMRFEKEADIWDLEEAIRLFRAALELRPPGHPHRLSSLQNLACCLRDRYANIGAVADLEEVVTLGRAELELRPPGHPDRAISLDNLACDLRVKFQNQPDMKDLDETIELYRAALELRPSRHPHQLSLLQTLACCLRDRYANLGGIADLEEVVALGRAVLEFHPPGHPDRDIALDDLARDLRTKFDKQADMQDLQEAIELCRGALELRLPGHPYRFSSLQNLALCLSDRCGNQAIVADIKETTTLGLTLRTFDPSGHTSCGAADLDEAIALEQEALQLLTPGDRHYDICRRHLTAHIQMKIKSQVGPLSSKALPVTHFDVKQVIRNVVFETLKAMPTRLLHTPTGILCNRDTRISHFLSSQQYNQLLSSCATCSPAQKMNLIHTEVSRYFQFVMLSHRWGEGEPSLRDIEGRLIYGMPIKGGFGKLHAFCAATCEKQYLWAWSDTCCIDKDSSAELQEAIGSMFAWYRRSALTIVYLADVPDTDSFLSSEWFRRGWTLQELLAPERLLFYNQTWSLHKNLTSPNHKADVTVLEELERSTGIESRFLTKFSPGMDDARLRLQWASLRCTTRPEDIAYSLFGIFNIHLPILYGESAENALGRLLAEIISQSGDISVLDWVGEASPFHSCLPAQITSYRELPLSPCQRNLEEHPYIPSQQSPSSISLRRLYGLLANSPLPRFINRRLILPCITHRVTGVQLTEADPFAPGYTYKIHASGLRPLEIALPDKLEDAAMEQGALQLVRPWHSKLLGPSVKVETTTEKQLLLTLEKPFNALLLIQLPHNEYKRIASSTLVAAQSSDSGSILQSKVRTLNIL
ncbi:hypothetical protein EDC04DRAFT_3066348 [Pisolithus marmoratus]|nr:hypothetical protein EDC04DRAFT_3066348 [Pisolithus marmoratus]